jgi:hypothetical protein
MTGLASSPIRKERTMRKLAVVLCAVPLLATVGCTDPYTGRVDLLRTGLLGAGLGAGAFTLGGAFEDSARGYGGHRRHYGHGYGYGGYGYRPHGGYGGGYGYGGTYLPPVAQPYGYGGGHGFGGGYLSPMARPYGHSGYGGYYGSPYGYGRSFGW